MKRLILLLWILLGTTDAWSWRCGSSLVAVEDRQREVLDDCGEPTASYSKQVAFELEIGASHQRRRYQTIDYWVYIKGWNTFARILFFRNGVLEDIRQGLYGREYNGDPEHCLDPGTDIELNQTQPELELLCGAPDKRRQIEQYTRPIMLKDNTRILETVVVEDWVYADDNNEVLGVFRFENGLLKWQGEKDRDEYNLLL